MRDFNEQRKSFWRGFVLFIILLAYVVVVVFGMGTKFANDFLVIKIFPTENDTEYWKSGSLVVSQYGKLKEGSKFIYKIYINGTAEYRTAKYVSNEGTTYNLLDENDLPFTETLLRKQIYGKALMAIPYVGVAVLYLQSATGTYIIIGSSVFVSLVLILAIVSAKRRKNNSRGLGLNYQRFNSEDAFIYNNLVHWFGKNGFKMDLGNNCEYVLLQGNTKHGQKVKLFAVLTFEQGSIFVKINHDYAQSTKFYTRDGYIKIEKAIYLDDAKKRIKEAYFRYFKKA